MALDVGQLAPDFVLKSHNGESIRLSSFRGKRNLVLAFFPLAWTPV
jgi:peroxiredoxin (alkyl hydroperoxide reductase subunit C)